MYAQKDEPQAYIQQILKIMEARGRQPVPSGKSSSPAPSKTGSGKPGSGSQRSSARIKSPMRARGASAVEEKPPPRRLTIKSPEHEDRYLRVIDMAGNGLTQLNPSIFTAKDVGELDISGNNLRTIPIEIRKLQHLVKLDVSRNGIRCSTATDYAGLPRELEQLPYLQILCISECNLQYVPPAIWRLKHLKRLDVSRNKIQILMPEIGNLVQLEHLNLQQTGITTLPIEIAYCQELREILLYGNSMESLPETLKEIPDLQVMPMNCQSFCSVIDDYAEGLIRKGQIPSEHIPLVLFECPSLMSLELDRCKMNSLPKECLPSMQEFNVSHNFFRTVPEALFKMEELTVLNISNNNIIALPEEFGKLSPSLQVLKFNNNLFERVPPSIGDLGGLELLEMGGNKIKRLPTTIGQLKQLQTLILDRNELQTLPDTICDLVSLETLDLTANKLVSLPLNMHKLTKITTAHSYRKLHKIGLWLHKNPLTTPPEEIWKTDNPKQIYDYLSKLKIARTELQRIKMLVVGDYQCGKSSFINAMINGKSKLTEAGVDGTTILEQKYYRTENGVEFSVNELGGHSVYKFTHPMFLDPKALVMLIYDHRSYTTQKHHDAIGYFLDMLSLHTPGAVIKIVGTQSDLCYPDIVDSTKTQVYAQVQSQIKIQGDRLRAEITKVDQQISKMQTVNDQQSAGALDFLKQQKDKLEHLLQNQIQVLPEIAIISSAEGTPGLRELISEIEVLAINSELFPHAQEITPPMWDKFRKVLRRKTELLLSWEEVKKVAEPFKFDDDELSACLDYMVDIGDVLWYPHNSKISHMIFQRPRQLVNVLKGIFRHNIQEFLNFEENKIFMSKGKFDQHSFKQHCDMFLNYGQISRPMMLSLWFYLDLKYDEFNSMVELMPSLDVLYVIPQPDIPAPKHEYEPLVCVPWYNSDMEALDLNHYWPLKLPNTLKEISVDYTFPMSFPDGLFERISIRIHDTLAERVDWRDLVYGKTDSGDQLVIKRELTTKSYDIVLSTIARGTNVESMIGLLTVVHKIFMEFASHIPGLIWYINKSYTNCGKRATLETLSHDAFGMSV